MARVRKEREGFVSTTLKSIENLPGGVCVRQRARFVGQTRLALGDGSAITANAIVIATGSRPTIPTPFARLGDILLTNETIFELPTLPRSIAVIGAGPLGLELAQALARLGADITVFDEGERVAALRDAEVARELRSVLGSEFPIHLGVKVEVEKHAKQARLSWSGASSGSARFERVLVAAGRPPALRGLDVEAAGLLTNEHGVPKFDPSTLQCCDAPIFLAGDVDGERAVLQEASAEGAIAGTMRPSFQMYGKPSGACPLPSCSRTRRSRLLARSHRMPWWSGAAPMPARGGPKSRPGTPGLSVSMPTGTGVSSRARVYSGLAWTTSPICSRGQSSVPKPRARCCSFHSTIRRSRKA
jgi:thioredoxin reductase